jgi:hypothetical protein
MAAFYQRNGGEQRMSYLDSFPQRTILVFLQQQDARTDALAVRFVATWVPSSFENTVVPLSKQPSKYRPRKPKIIHFYFQVDSPITS